MIVENLKKAAKANSVRLRIPLIAGFNDSEAHLERVAQLGKELRAERISLLPYHEGGRSKWEQMGMSYPFPEGKSPDDEQVQRLRSIVETSGIEVAVSS